MSVDRHATDAERTALGILIDRPDLVRRAGFGPDDLDPTAGHPLVLQALQTMAEQGRAGNVTLLAEELRARGDADRIGGGGYTRGLTYLTELWAARTVAPELPHLAGLIRTASARRRAVEVADRLRQAATTQPDPEAFLDALAAQAVDLHVLADESGQHDGPVQGLSLVSDVIERPSPPRRWVIPGVLERTDRVLLVAPEGVGKSVLSRTVGACVAAGVHPFRPKLRIPPKRVLLIDLENPETLSDRGLRAVVAPVGGGKAVGDRFMVWNWPQGLDVRTAGGRSLLIRAIEQARPDLVCIGPLYKLALTRAGDSYELAAQETATVLDSIRQRYGCALWIEHHMAKGDGSTRSGNPLGSSYWMRWPEFGLQLGQDDPQMPTRYALGRFRGDREVRCWPSHLLKGAGPLLWTADYSDEPELLDELMRVADDAAQTDSPAA